MDPRGCHRSIACRRGRSIAPAVRLGDGVDQGEHERSHAGGGDPAQLVVHGRHDREDGPRCLFRHGGHPGRDLVPPPPEPDGRTASIFYGRIALNIDWSRRCADLQPGTSGDALEEYYFGAVRPGVTSRNSRRRYPAILAKMPPLAWRVPRSLRALYTDNWRWWQSCVARGVQDGPAARRQFVEAHDRFDTIARTHVAAALIGGSLYPSSRRPDGRGRTP